MVDFVCDDSEIEKVLTGLYEQVQAGGAFIHDKLTIESSAGDFHIRAASDIPQGERILALPERCLLPAKKFRMELESDSIVISSHDDDLDSLQVDMMQSMVRLYNLTGKIATEKKISTLSLYYEDSDLLAMLFRGRGTDEDELLEMAASREQHDFYMDSFLNSRVLGFKMGGIQSGEEYERTRMFMPIADFLNHHPGGMGFIRQSGDTLAESIPGAGVQGGVTVLNFCPDAGSNECYVNYGPYDALDSLLHYNYVDQNSAFVRSVPLACELPGLGTISIRSAIGMLDYKKLPEKLMDIRLYVPGIKTDRDENHVELSFLYIPVESAPRSMRRVLGLALNHLGVGMEDAGRKDYIRQLESRVIAANMQYFQGLLDYLDSHVSEPVLPVVAENIRGMARHQLDMIGRYMFFDEAAVTP